MKSTTISVKTSIKIILVCTISILAYLIWFQLNKPVELSKIISVENKSAIKQHVSLPEMKYETSKISDYEEIINRPLFFEDRKPFVYVAPQIPQKKEQKKKRPVAKKKEEYALNAVIITSDKKIAIIQTGRNKTSQRIPQGETIEGWLLDDIQPHSVVLKKGSETKNLELEVITSKPISKITAKANKQGNDNPINIIKQKAARNGNIAQPSNLKNTQKITK
jgi:type II secretory pathway component PulC